MAEEEKTKEKPEDEEASSGHKGLYRIVLLLIVVVMAGGAGFGAALVMGGPQQAGADDIAGGQDDVPLGSEDDYGYITDFPPITVNLNVENVNRYVRTTLVIAVKKKKLEELQKIVTEQTPQLKNVLTVYLSGLTLDEVRGEDKLNKIRRDVADKFNEQLWGDGKPQIQKILFDEFKVQ